MNNKIEAPMIHMEDLRHPLWITALSMARRVLAISATPAITEPHASRVSVSHPLDMHAQAIITAPMRNTKSEPIAHLRIQGMVSSEFQSSLSIEMKRSHS